MKSLYRLLPLLSHDRYQSGQKLAETLGVTRPTISNWVAELGELGLDVYTVKGRGYRLAEPISLLERATIIDALNPELVQALSVFDIQSDVDSTNRWVLDQKPDPGRWSICAADYQHQGRGRRGRSWRSPPGSSIMVSVAVRENLSGDALYCASLIVGVAVVRAIEAVIGVCVDLKWPNDIYYRDQKLGGILCELQGNPLDQPVVVIGLGLNVNKGPAGLDRDVGCLADIHGQLVDRNRLLTEVLNHLHAVLSELQAPGGLDRLLAEWGRYDCVRDRDIRLIRGDAVETVTARGIDGQGQLLVENPDGSVRAVNGGEVSVRW
ncbi:biotin--[acetyl-CoA-carboxylase] ligase [Saccharospirillum salsuginis]|uniref:Bifunctional ligase/repressor BirA n=1 Tax=Saccharospirillum salsuginis TaxID=418750 RepID=A0A918KWB8_9GAMM|nr:biotin--[acetyl-CoA-carboxylase] ligase [Saccharospirillum salsuginis]GGX76195.1 bifunctional ligase/repressor BirA [Saccharospirillum salsuginis]